MNITRIALTSLAAFIAYFAAGSLFFVLLPGMRTEFAKYSNIYRPHEQIMKVFPLGMAFMLLAILVLTILYSMMYKGGWGVAEGARFGVLIGLFVLGAFVVHNYVNLQIGGKLTVLQGVAYFVEWLLVGIVIGAVYRP